MIVNSTMSLFVSVCRNHDIDIKTYKSKTYYWNGSSYSSAHMEGIGLCNMASKNLFILIVANAELNGSDIHIRYIHKIMFAQI